MRRTHRRLILAAFLATHVALPVQSAAPDDLCRAAAASAAAETGVPVAVLLALTLTETGRAIGDQDIAPWAWALNEGGKSHWFDTRDAALDHLAQAVADGTTNIDVGCFQLNYRWHAGAFASLEDMMDPTLNAVYAGQYIASLYETTGDWTAAAAAYHSSTPEYAERYLARFEPIYAAVSGDSVPSAPLAGEPLAANDATPAENLYPLLRGGTGGTGGSLVPLGGAARPLIGGS